MSEGAEPGDFGQAIDTSGSEPAALTELRQGSSPDLENAGGGADLAAIGVPQDVSGYDLSGIQRHETLPWSNDFQGRMVNTMHRLGRDNEQVAGLIQSYIQDQGGQFDAMTSDGER